MKSLLIVSICCAASAVSLAGPAHYLIAGGGFYAGHSEVVLEKNVGLFRQTADFFGIPAASQFTLFASGTDVSIVDVGEIDPTVTADEIIFAHLFENAQHPDLKLRHNQLTDLLGASTAPNIRKLLLQAGTSTSASTPFRFYYTGHGATLAATPPAPQTTVPGVIVPVGSVPKSLMPDYRNNYMALWNDTQLGAPEFSTFLDGLTSDTPVQTVMVQCYSGGFAQMIFEKGDPDGPLSSANRCGFFATVPSRVAAGCSPDLNHREEYSPYFFAAVSGKTEAGKVVDADYDGNGTVTSDEAHAFVLLYENAIDVPISTSSQLLRERFESIPKAAGALEWKWFDQRLNPAERAVTDGLAHELAFDLKTASPGPVAAVRKKISKFYREWQKTKNQADMAGAKISDTIAVIESDLLEDHPVLRRAYPLATEANTPLVKFVAQARAAFVAHPNHLQAVADYLAMQQASDDASAAQHKFTKWERLGYLLETKVLENSLEDSIHSQWAAKYQQLKACEKQAFFQ